MKKLHFKAFDTNEYTHRLQMVAAATKFVNKLITDLQISPIDVFNISMDSSPAEKGAYSVVVVWFWADEEYGSELLKD